jgi:putative FmdB family regulatory protein
VATYTYECKNCGEFEATQSMKDDAYTECPKCSGKEIKRLIGKGSGFILKGSGFYETDYKKIFGDKAIVEEMKVDADAKVDVDITAENAELTLDIDKEKQKVND